MTHGGAARRKMLGFVNWKVRVELTDTRAVVGQLMAFDKHLNVVLGDVEEIRLVMPDKKKGTIAKPVEEKRQLGMILLRGNQVLSMKPVSPPGPKPKLPSSTTAAAAVGPMPVPGAPPQARPMMMAPPMMAGMPPMGMPGMPPMGMPPMGMPRPGMPPMMHMMGRPPMPPQPK